MTPRVVLDTNVLVSALLKPQGLEAQVLRFALSGHLTLCTSPAVLAEYAGVLSRPKFKLTPADVDRVMAELTRGSTTVLPKDRVTVSPDESDNRFLECAEAAGATYLITGNTRHFPRRWKTTRIGTARELLSGLRRVDEPIDPQSPGL